METSLQYGDQNNTSFPIILKNNLKQFGFDPKKEFLKYPQFITLKYLASNPKARGLLIYYQVGVGKTIVAASVADYYRQFDPDRKIIVLLSKSLMGNFKQGIKKYLDSAPEHKGTELDKDSIIDKFKFISLNSQNMLKNMYNIDKTTDDLNFEKSIKKFTQKMGKDPKALENSLIIIDEAHNLFNSITNHSKNGTGLYDLIMKTRNIKLVFLTGTPIINDPFELVPCFNMLKGTIYNKHTRVVSTLFPENYGDFTNYFIDKKNLTIKHPEFFKNRVFGLSSYFGELYVSEEERLKNYPKQLAIKVIKVPMSSLQFSIYDAYREKERDEASRGGKMNKADRFKATSDAQRSYRVKSRQCSNYLWPEYAYGKKIKDSYKARKKLVNVIKVEDLRNLELYSPKMKMMLKNIKNHPKQLGLVYSNFVTGEGIAVFARILQLFGWKKWSKTGQAYTEKHGGFDIKFDGDGTPQFAILTGETPFEMRTEIVREFSKPDNKHGKNIRLLIISSTGAEGLDLKFVRHVHIMEPFWNYARIEQVIARAVRYQSHTSLPENERDVQPYVYLSTYPNDYDKKRIKEPTTDEEIWTTSVKGRAIIDTFLLAIAESSIDCSIHTESISKELKDKINCKMCAPNNTKLYNPVISQDSFISNPCKKFEKQSVQVHEIELDEKKFYYTLDDEDPVLFEFSESVNGYVQLTLDRPEYPILLQKIMELNNKKGGGRKLKKVFDINKWDKK